MNWNSIWNSIVEFFTGNIWSIIGFFATLFIGVIVVKLILNITRTMLKKAKMERIAQQFICTSLKLILYLVLVLILLSVLGIQINGIITALSALLLAVGMALQNNIANVANGIIIVSTKMFKKGDYITVGDVSGSITDINFMFVTLTTSDNKKVTLPNSQIINSEVINAGANKTRRVEWTFSVAYESDVEQVKNIILDVISSNGKVYINDKYTPFCRLKTLGINSLDFFAHCWVDSEDYWDVYYYVVETVYNEFKKNGISVPFTQLEVRNRVDVVDMPFDKKPLPDRVEKKRVVNENFDLETANLAEMFHKAKRKREIKKVIRDAKLKTVTKTSTKKSGK